MGGIHLHLQLREQFRNIKDLSNTCFDGVGIQGQPRLLNQVSQDLALRVHVHLKKGVLGANAEV